MLRKKEKVYDERMRNASPPCNLFEASGRTLHIRTHFSIPPSFMILESGSSLVLINWSYLTLENTVVSLCHYAILIPKLTRCQGEFDC